MMKEKQSSANSFEDRFYIENPGAFERLKRNSSLLLLLLSSAMAWLFAGGRLRRAIRKAKRSKRPLFLEDWTD